MDKTLLIRDFIDERPQVSLFTRPRRFGKTLNMDMLRVFLNGRKRIHLFTSEIRKSGNAAREYQSIKENIRLLCNLQGCKM